MKYRAGIEPDRGDYRAMVAADFGDWGPEADDADSSNRLSRLTMRHARALLEVYRAGRALVRAHRLSDAARAHAARASSAILDDALGGVARANATTRRALDRLTRAVAKLEAVEKEVRRG